MTSTIRYKRSRFSTRLIEHRLYTAGHSWLEQVEGEDDLWRVGFTKFAARMLGDIVDLGFDVEAGTALETGQVVGWLEGFKAVTDVFSPLAGHFERVNPAIDQDVGIVTADPYVKGWLFEVRGQPGDACISVQEYVSLLDTTIDKMLGERHE